MARRKYLFPFRTQKSSSSAAIILRKWETSTVPNYTITPGNTRGFVLSCYNETINTCEICPIITNPSAEEAALRVLEGEYWRVTLRLDQEYLGAAFITAKRHVSSLPDLTELEEKEFISIRNQIIMAQMNALGAQVVNVSCLMNLAFTGCRGDCASIEVRDGDIDSHPVAYGKSALRKKRPISQIGSFSFFGGCVCYIQTSALFVHVE